MTKTFVPLIIFSHYTIEEGTARDKAKWKRNDLLLPTTLYTHLNTYHTYPILI